MERPIRLRDHLIGLFALVHVVLVGSAALGRAADLPGPLALASGAWNRWSDVDRAVLRPYGELLGPKQAWSMFAGVGTENTRFRIDVREQGRWRPVYVERSDEATWNRHRFDHYRWREYLFALGRDEDAADPLARFVDGLAPQVLADHPEACQVRARVEISPIPTASERAAGARMQFDEVRHEHLAAARRPCP